MEMAYLVSASGVHPSAATKTGVNQGAAALNSLKL